jgi:LysR family hydrogen peroxide-inducible transcriptional activator
VPKDAEHVKYRYLADPEISRTIQAIYQTQVSPKSELQDLLAKLKTGL